MAGGRRPSYRPPSPDPGRAQGPLQLMGPGDNPMQKLALMMALMILGMSPAMAAASVPTREARGSGVKRR